MSDHAFTADQREVLEPMLTILRAMPPAERPEVIEALVSQFVEVFRQDWPERGEDEVRRYGDLIRASLDQAESDAASSLAKAG